MAVFDSGPEAVDSRAFPGPTNPAAERALVAAVQQGDVDAFRTIHQHYVVDLLDFAYTYLRSREDAEEAVQDLFLWIWEHRHEWNVPGGVRAYLFKAVRNRSINRLRQQRVQARFAERVGRPDSPQRVEALAAHDPLTALTADELDTVLTRAIEGLSPRGREVFLLIRERRLSYAQVAELLGISPKTVENHMTAVLGILRARVAEWRGR